MAKISSDLSRFEMRRILEIIFEDPTSDEAMLILRGIREDLIRAGIDPDEDDFSNLGEKDSVKSSSQT